MLLNSIGFDILFLLLRSEKFAYLPVWTATGSESTMFWIQWSLIKGNYNIYNTNRNYFFKLLQQMRFPSVFQRNIWFPLLIRQWLYFRCTNHWPAFKTGGDTAESSYSIFKKFLRVNAFALFINSCQTSEVYYTYFSDVQVKFSGNVHLI